MFLYSITHNTVVREYFLTFSLQIDWLHVAADCRLIHFTAVIVELMTWQRKLAVFNFYQGYLTLLMGFKHKLYVKGQCVSYFIKNKVKNKLNLN